MDKIIKQINEGKFVLDSHSAEYIARLWFIHEMIGWVMVIVMMSLIAWGIRSAWKHFKHDL